MLLGLKRRAEAAAARNRDVAAPAA